MTKWLKSGLRRLGVIVMRSHHRAARYVDDPPQSLFEDILWRYFPRLDDLRFLQIGANDGIRADPVRRHILRYGWTGLLLEPLPYFFEQLRKNYRGQPGLKFLNAAVDVAAAERPIYFLKPDWPGLPDWAHGLGSFDPARLQHEARQLALTDDAIAQQRVRTMTWDQVLADFGPRPCDVLVLDTEGYDVRLLRAAPLASWRPRVIHFEHAWVPEAERMSFYTELVQLGYEIASSEGDTIAWLKAPTTAAP